MSDETKVPPGFIVLTDDNQLPQMFPLAWLCVSFWTHDETHVWNVGESDSRTLIPQPFSEVAALIAEAEAAERRARALPVMAAACFLARATHPGADVDVGMAVGDAAAILDAIERREATDG